MRAEKQQLVQDIGMFLGASAHMFLVSYKGMKVADFAKLRQDLAEQGAECHVVPNRLLKKAMEASSLECLNEYNIVGDNAVVSGGSDPVAIAKVIRDFAKDVDAMEVRVGILDGALLQETQVKELANLPSREVLLAQLLGVLQAPSQQLVGVLNSKVASVVYALQAYLDTKSA